MRVISSLNSTLEHTTTFHRAISCDLRWPNLRRFIVLTFSCNFSIWLSGDSLIKKGSVGAPRTTPRNLNKEPAEPPEGRSDVLISVSEVEGDCWTSCASICSRFCLGTRVCSLVVCGTIQDVTTTTTWPAFQQTRRHGPGLSVYYLCRLAFRFLWPIRNG